QYIDDLIQQYGISEAGTRKVPMGSFVLHDDSQPVDDNLLVRELVGSLQYLAHKSRPDICASVQILSRYMHKPTTALFQGATSVLRYLKGTKDFMLHYASKDIDGNRLKVTLYTDAHFGPKPVSGILLQLNASPIYWTAQKQGAC